MGFRSDNQQGRYGRQPYFFNLGPGSKNRPGMGFDDSFTPSPGIMQRLQRGGRRGASPYGSFYNQSPGGMPFISPELATASRRFRDVGRVSANQPASAFNQQRRDALEGTSIIDAFLGSQQSDRTLGLLRDMGFAPQSGVAFDPSQGTIGGLRTTFDSIEPARPGGGIKGRGAAAVANAGQFTANTGKFGRPVSYDPDRYGGFRIPTTDIDRREEGALATLPDILAQYNALANHGRFNEFGMQKIKDEIGQYLFPILANEGNTLQRLNQQGALQRNRATAGLKQAMGGRVSPQALARSNSNLMQPNLDAQAARSLALKDRNENLLLNFGQFGADLRKENVRSKEAGLAGALGVLGQIDQRKARREGYDQRLVGANINFDQMMQQLGVGFNRQNDNQAFASNQAHLDRLQQERMARFKARLQEWFAQNQFDRANKYTWKDAINQVGDIVESFASKGGGG